MTSCAIVRNNEQFDRYELDAEGGLAIAAYGKRDGALLFTHTEAPKALEGQGIASLLIKGALADARARSLKVVPLCEFVTAYLERHPEE